MKIFDYPEAKQVLVSGDIHGDFKGLVFKLCVQYGCRDSPSGQDYPKNVTNFQFRSPIVAWIFFQELLYGEASSPVQDQLSIW